jgi:hypothetical protein
MQLARTIFSDSAIFIEKKRIENRLWPKSEFLWPKKFKRCVHATDELSRLTIETASQRPATLKDFRTQELVFERQTRLWESSKFQLIGEEIAKKKFCRFQT